MALHLPAERSEVATEDKKANEKKEKKKEKAKL